ncbi:MAG: hemolysin [Verrucomicrobia bacterium]|nr:MAG: hemolysin [Verrucomicrobiota bacterium]
MAFTLHTHSGFRPPPPTEQYRISLALNEETVRDAQRLRFEVFNLEMDEGLEQSVESGLDQDEFDPVCDHLIVELVETGEVIGTYRLQTGPTARDHFGYYSEREFVFEPFEPFRAEILELGRACVAKNHRNLAVLGLLWKGLARYARHNRSRYMIGCSSLTSRNPADGPALYDSLPSKWLAAAPYRTVPHPELICEGGNEPSSPPKVPRLMKGYLLQGAQVCGPPALDGAFGTIDFLTIMDVRNIPSRYFH